MRPVMRQPLIRLFVVNGVLGVFFGLAIAAVLVATDFRGVATLATTASNGAVAIAMLAAGLSITCGGAAIATAVMLLPWSDDDDGPGSGGGRRGEEEPRERRIFATIPVERPRGRHGLPGIPRRD